MKSENSFTLKQRFYLANDWWIYPIQRWRRDLPMRFAWWLPKSVALWAFIRVYAADGQAPGPDYETKYKFWVQKHGELR